MADIKRPVGRPGRYANFQAWEASLPDLMTKRAVYFDGIGIFKGATTTTVFVKVRFPRGGSHRGRPVPPGEAVELKLGKRSSWGWSELVEERDRLQRLADQGKPLEPVEVQTFAAYASAWLDRRRPTLRGYSTTKGHITSDLNPTFGQKALNAITVADVNDWIGSQRERLAPATVQRQLSTFNAILNEAVRTGVLERNPSERANPIRGIKARERFVTEAEWQCILETVDKIELEQEASKERQPQRIRGWLRHYVVWALESGMRRSEILNLTWAQVRPIDDTHTVIEVVNSKTGRPRFVHCTPGMLSLLTSLADLDRDAGDGRLFPVSLTTLKRALSKLWKATGLPNVRLHDLRRTHATMLVKLGVDPRTVAGRLGHSGTAMLARHYAVDLGDMEAASKFSSPAPKGARVRETIDPATEIHQVQRESLLAHKLSP